MPYASRAQAGFFHTNPEKVGGAKVVKEFDEASRGMKLPARVQRYSGHNSPPYDKPAPTRDASDRGTQYPSAPRGPERPTRPAGDRSTQYSPKRDGNNYPAPAGDEALPGPRGAQRSRSAGSTRQSLDPYPGLKNWREKTNSGGREFDEGVRDIPRKIKGPKSTSDRFQAETKKPARGRDRQDSRAPASVGAPDNVPGRPTAGLIDPTRSDQAGSVRGTEASDRVMRFFGNGMISRKSIGKVNRDRSRDPSYDDFGAYKSSF